MAADGKTVHFGWYNLPIYLCVSQELPCCKTSQVSFQEKLEFSSYNKVVELKESVIYTGKLVITIFSDITWTRHVIHL